jgi:two-component system, LytTR family, response regulator
VKTAKWTALIADDEPAARRGVRQLLASFPEFAVAGECRNGAEVLTALNTSSPDVVFLDIQMPGIDGFEVIKRRSVERMPAVVFLTAFDQFALRAFETEALDYLVKPVSEAPFAETVAVAADSRLATRGNDRGHHVTRRNGAALERDRLDRSGWKLLATVGRHAQLLSARVTSAFTRTV